MSLRKAQMRNFQTILVLAIFLPVHVAFRNIDLLAHYILKDISGKLWQMFNL